MPIINLKHTPTHMGNLLFDTKTDLENKTGGLSLEVSTEVAKEFEDYKAKYMLEDYTNVETEFNLANNINRDFRAGVAPETIKDFKLDEQITTDDLNDYIAKNDLEETIEGFTGGGYSNVSANYRRKRISDDEWADIANMDRENLDKLFEAVGDYTDTTYRGGTVKIGNLQMLEEGEVLRTQAPISSSKNKSTAVDFAFNKENTRKGLNSIIDMPVVFEFDNDAKAQYNIQPYSTMENEAEVLIKNNDLFQVQEIKDAIDETTGQLYKHIKVTPVFNVKAVLEFMQERFPNIKINNKILSVTALGLALQLQEEANANPLIAGNVGKSLASSLAETGGIPYSDVGVQDLLNTVIPEDKRPTIFKISDEIQKYYKDMTPFMIAMERNLYSQLNYWNDQKIDQEPSFEWVNGGEKAWEEENLQYFTPTMKEAYDEIIAETGGFNNEELANNFIRRQLQEEIGRQQMYSGNFIEAFASDLTTGLAQPADIPLSIITFGAYKAYKSTRSASRAYNAFKNIGEAAIFTGGFSLASEESRQFLANIDMNDEYLSAGMGATLGASFASLATVWGKLKPSEQVEQVLAAESYADRYFRPIEENPAPTGTPFVPGVNTNYNPSPLIALYGHGKDYLYDFLDRVAPAFVTLVDDAGKPVTQTTKSAWQITDHWIDSHYKVFETKMQSAQKQSGMKRDEFGGAVTLAARQQAELHKAKMFKISVLEDKITKTEDVQTKQLLENELEIVKQEEVETIPIENASVAEAVKLTQKFWKDYNTKFKNLEIKKAQEELEAKRGDMDEAEYTALHDKTIENINKKYDGRADAYFARFWDKNKIIEDPNAKVRIADAIRRSSAAEAYRLYDPDEYAKLMDEADEIAANMVQKIKNSSHNIELDFSNIGKSGQGDSTKSKSDIGRRIDVMDEAIMDYTQSDIVEVTHAYSYDNAHKIGLREALNVKDGEELTKVWGNKLEEAINNDTSLTSRQVKQIKKDLNAVYETAAGTRALTTDPSSGYNVMKRFFSNMQNMWYSAGMGEMSLSELGTGWKVGGRDFITSLVPAMKKVAKDYLKRGYTPEQLQDHIDALDGIALGTSVVHSNIERKFGDGTFYRFNENDTLMSKASELMGKVSNIGFHIGGLNGLATTIQYAAAMGLMKRVHRIGTRLNEGGRLSRAERNQFARWGLSEADIQAIAREPLRDADGLANYSMDGWGDVSKEKMYRAMWSGGKEAVLVDNPYALPKPFTDPGSTGAIVQTLGQYMKHPIMSYNALFKNGWNDRDATALASAGFSFGILATALYTREQLAIELGLIDEIDAQYDIDTEEGMNTLLLKTASIVPQLFYLSKLYDAGAALGGQENIITGYTNKPEQIFMGVTGSTTRKVAGIMSDSTFIPDEYDDFYISPKALKLLPIVNSWPGSDYFMNKVIEDIEYEGWE